MENQQVQIDKSLFSALKGRCLVVTGGSSGIGLATARLFLNHGASVVVGDLNAPPAEIVQSVAFKKTNVSSYASLVELFEFARDQNNGRWPDVVFANAGISERGDPFGASASLHDEPDHSITAVNVTSVANTAKLAFYAARQNNNNGSGKGVQTTSLIMTASMAGYRGHPELPIYTATKHAVVGLLRSLRYLGPRANVACSLIAPAITSTPLIVPDEARSRVDYRHVAQSMINGKVSVNTPEQVAEAVAYLAALGPKANGVGLSVIDGECVDLERGIARTARLWLSEKSEKAFRSGDGSYAAHTAKAAGSKL